MPLGSRLNGPTSRQEEGHRDCEPAFCRPSPPAIAQKEGSERGGGRQSCVAAQGRPPISFYDPLSPGNAMALGSNSDFAQ